MRNLVVGGLAALGLVGGTAAVVYNDSGDATVKIKENGVTRSVEIKGSSGGPKYSCPEVVVDEKVTPTVELAGRIKLTLHDVETQLGPLESQLDAIQQRYRGGEAPGPVADHYNELLSQYNGLVDRAEGLQSAYNDAVDKHNAVMAQECERE